MAGDPQVDIAKAQLCHVFFVAQQKKKNPEKWNFILAFFLKII